MVGKSKSGSIDKKTIKLKAPYGYYIGKVRNNKIKLRYRNTKNAKSWDQSTIRFHKSCRPNFTKVENIQKPKLTSYNEDDDPSVIWNKK